MEKIQVLLIDEDRYGIVPTSFKAAPEINDNCIVSFCTSMDTALAEFKTRIFDVVILTIDTSEGLFFIKELKKIDPDCCLISFIFLDNKELMQELKRNYTIIIVTHNMQQAARVSDETGFMLLGELIEFAKTEDIFTKPKDKRTEDYITGKYG